MTEKIPEFNEFGLLPPGDYPVTFDELRESPLVLGPQVSSQYSSWDVGWRGWLIDQLKGEDHDSK